MVTRVAMPRGRCLETLRDVRLATVREVAERTGLSRPTVESTLAVLMAEGLVEEDSALAPPGEGGGRPARRFRFRAERHHVVGLDLSDTHERLAIADLAGDVVHTDIHGPACPRTGAADIAPLLGHVADAFAAARIPMTSLSAVTVAIPGIVTPDHRLASSPAVREWSGVDLAARLTELFGCPVIVENDLVLAAAAEARLGASRLADTSLYVLAWFHLSARLVSGGRVHVGRHHQAGEMASLRLLAGPKRGDEQPWDSLDATDLILAGAGAGDPAGRALAEELTGRMAPALGGLLAAVDPDLVVLGGRLGKYADLLAPMLRTKLSELLALPFEYPIVGHLLGELDVAAGGVLRALETVTDTLLGVPDITVPTIRLDPLTARDRAPQQAEVLPIPTERLRHTPSRI